MLTAIMAAWQQLARAEGILPCPEVAATYAAYRQLLAEERLDSDAPVVVFNCATSLKYPMPDEAET